MLSIVTNRKEAPKQRQVHQERGTTCYRKVLRVLSALIVRIIHSNIRPIMDCYDKYTYT